jgi:hypothetical protein
MERTDMMERTDKLGEIYDILIRRAHGEVERGRDMSKR